MTHYHAGNTVVLAGHGFDEQGPYLLLNDLDAVSQERLHVRGRTFTLRRTARRFCVGRFDLQTFEKSVCPLRVELLSDAKDIMCLACAEATGFNPSFYYADYVSPQQRAYNLTPHFVYLAYFSPQHVKAGISSTTRGIERLLEQGARAARVVGRFPNADKARALEAALCAQDGILETMRASLKTRLLAEVRYSFAEATTVLDAAAQRLAEVPAVAEAGFTSEAPLDLDAYYFDGAAPDVHDIQQPDDHDDECGGCCVGMVGGTLLFEQEGAVYTAPVKDWESHEVELLDGEVACSYDFEPQQFSLF